MPDPKTKQVIEDGIEAWRANREGRQIASVNVLRGCLDQQSLTSFTAGFSPSLARRQQPPLLRRSCPRQG